MEMRREGKEVAFQDGNNLKTINMTIFIEDNKHTAHVLIDIHKKNSRKNTFRFFKQNTYKLKDLNLCKVLWTTCIACTLLI